MSDIWEPLWLSLRIATAATVLVALVAIPVAFVMSRHAFPGKSIVEALLIVPLVLPPTVVGYFIIVTLGARGWLGQWLHELFDYSVMFRIEGAILAAAVVALPLLYMPAKAAFASVDRELQDIATLLGANRFRMFWHVSLPLARRGIASGLLLAFARALGEFGATIMVFGWRPRNLTLPISIYTDYERGDLSSAAAAVLALTVVSFGLILIYNRSLRSKTD